VPRRHRARDVPHGAARAARRGAPALARGGLPAAAVLQRCHDAADAHRVRRPQVRSRPVPAARTGRSLISRQRASQHHGAPALTVAALCLATSQRRNPSRLSPSTPLPQAPRPHGAGQPARRLQCDAHRHRLHLARPRGAQRSAHQLRVPPAGAGRADTAPVCGHPPGRQPAGARRGGRRRRRRRRRGAGAARRRRGRRLSGVAAEQGLGRRRRRCGRRAQPAGDQGRRRRPGGCVAVGSSVCLPCSSERRAPHP
jgi:hypothetical protein